MNAEKALLSQLIQDNQIYYNLQPRKWWFVDPLNAYIFSAIESALTDGEADLISVSMKAKGHAGEVAELTSLVPTTANAKYYAGVCKENGQRNEIKKLSAIISDSVKQDAPDETVVKIDEIIEKCFIDSGEHRITSLAEMLPEIVQDLESRFKQKGVMPGITTHIHTLDDMTMGFQPERFYVIGARPSQGKSALMLNLAQEISKEKNVGIISLESSMKEVLIRELSLISRINSQHLISGKFLQSDFSKILNACERINKTKMYVYDKPFCTLTELIGQARRMVNRYKIDILFIDYLQLVQAPGDDRERVSLTSRRLKDLSRELKIPIVALAQLRRDSDGRRPHLGDFQHTSQIEQDADVAMLIYHRVIDAQGNTLHKPKPEGNETTSIVLLVEKNRDGRTGAVPLHFEPEYVRFEERGKIGGK